MTGFAHLFRFNLKRILSLWRTHMLMAFMLAVLGFAFSNILGPSPDEARRRAVVAMFCGNFLVFNSLMIVFLLSENIFFLEKRNKIMESVFSGPVGHNTVLLSKAAALASVAWGYPLLVLSLVLAYNWSLVSTAVCAANAALLLCVMPLFMFAASVITGVFLLLSRDIRVKNFITSAVLFAVMGLSKHVMAVSTAAGFWPVTYAYGAVAVLFLGFAGFIIKTIYTKASILDSSY
jgi:hypothetical protein